MRLLAKQQPELFETLGDQLLPVSAMVTVYKINGERKLNPEALIRKNAFSYYTQVLGVALASTAQYDPEAHTILSAEWVVGLEDGSPVIEQVVSSKQCKSVIEFQAEGLAPLLVNGDPNCRRRLRHNSANPGEFMWQFVGTPRIVGHRHMYSILPIAQR